MKVKITYEIVLDVSHLISRDRITGIIVGCENLLDDVITNTLDDCHVGWRTLDGTLKASIIDTKEQNNDRTTG